MYSTITLVLSSLFILLFTFLYKKNSIKNPNLWLKALAVSFCLLGILRYFFADAFVETEFGFTAPLQSFLRWGYHIGYAIIPMSIFFDARLFRNIASYFTLPVSILCAIFYENTFEYFVAPGAGGFYVALWIRYVTYTLELALAIALPVLMQITNKHAIDLKNKKEILASLGALPLILIQMIPSYIPLSLISNLEMGTGMFGELHILWLVSLVAECILLYIFFRKRSEKDRYMLLVFMVIAQVMHTTSPMIRGFTFSRLPLQLCNIAAFFYLYMIIKRDRKIFDFCYLSNLVGAVIAMVLVDFSSQPLTFWNIHYIYEHSFVVMVPILAYLLGIFPRLDKSAIKNMLKYFTIYFIFVFVFGTIVNGLDTTPDYFPVNHFYMFNPEVAVDYIPFVGFTGAVHWTFGDFEVYPILVVTIFIVFVCLNLLFYLITRGIYKISDIIKRKISEKALKSGS